MGPPSDIKLRIEKREIDHFERVRQNESRACRTGDNFTFINDISDEYKIPIDWKKYATVQESWPSFAKKDIKQLLNVVPDLEGEVSYVGTSTPSCFKNIEQKDGPVPIL